MAHVKEKVANDAHVRRIDRMRQIAGAAAFRGPARFLIEQFPGLLEAWKRYCGKVVLEHPLHHHDLPEVGGFRPDRRGQPSSPTQNKTKNGAGVIAAKKDGGKNLAIAANFEFSPKKCVVV